MQVEHPPVAFGLAAHSESMPMRGASRVRHVSGAAMSSFPSLRFEVSDSLRGSILIQFAAVTAQRPISRAGIALR
jgi:hypothetical protein